MRTMRQALREAALDPVEYEAAFAWVEELQERIMAAWSASEALTARLRELARRAATLSNEMRFDFLFDPARKLFTIGYNVTDERADTSS
jgi:cyclic beta-1,2-glucan synthetase